jgi:hypothetical protein
MEQGPLNFFSIYSQLHSVKFIPLPRNLARFACNFYKSVNLKAQQGAQLASVQQSNTVGVFASSMYKAVIFSHGLAAHRHLYSVQCLELASKGHFVFSVEHQDRLLMPHE